MKSTCWKSLEEKEKLHLRNLGILNGLAGVGYSLLGLPRQEFIQKEKVESK